MSRRFHLYYCNAHPTGQVHSEKKIYYTIGFLILSKLYWDRSKQPSLKSDKVTCNDN